VRQCVSVSHNVSSVSSLTCVSQHTWSSRAAAAVLVCVTDVEKDTSLRMSDTVEKIKQLMSDQRTARTCESYMDQILVFHYIIVCTQALYQFTVFSYHKLDGDFC